MSSTAATPSGAVAVSLEGSIVVAFVLLIEIPILTGVRFWVMRHNNRTHSRTVSDCFFILYTILTLSCSVPLFINMFHEKYRGPAAFSEGYMKNAFAIGLLYTLEMWSIKAAFLALYFDLKSHLTKTMLTSLYITACWLVVTFLGNFLFQLLYCHPFYTFWSIGEDSCSSIMSVPWTVVTSWTNITGDVAILGIGLAIVSSLRVSRREKYALLVVGCVGSISIASTLIRFVLCYRMALASGEGTPDLIHSINTWSVMELLMAHIAFCLLSFKVLLDRPQDRKEMQNRSKNWSRAGKNSHGKDVILVSHSIDMESLKSGSDTELTRPFGPGVYIGRAD